MDWKQGHETNVEIKSTPVVMGSRETGQDEQESDCRQKTDEIQIPSLAWGIPQLKSQGDGEESGKRSRLNSQLRWQGCGLVSQPQEAINSIWRFLMKSSSKRDLKEPTW